MFKKLPSPKWMGFGCVVGTLIGGAAYDRYEQNQIRSKYMEFVSVRQEMETNVKPRKIIVVVAPPPNDYLDTSLKLWRRWIKPILYANGLDYELVTGDQQGAIRQEIASRVRNLRKELLREEQEINKQAADKGFLNGLPLVRRLNNKSKENVEEITVEQHQRFDVRNVLGVFYQNSPKEVVMEDALLDPEVCGGVICIGRGAYREYIAGLHEGILGPLEEPIQDEKEDKASVQEQQQQGPGEDVGNSSANVSVPNNVVVPEVTKSTADDDISNEGSKISSSILDAQHIDESTSTSNKIEDEVTVNEHDDDKKDEGDAENKKILKPFITASEYSSASFPIELSQTIVRDPVTNVPAFFQQPILVIPVPNLSGFTTIPTRIMRFYQRRNQCEQTCRATLAMVESKSRPFTSTDLDLASYEELDWPKKWVQQGLERGSEWVQEFRGDTRVMEKLKVIEPSAVEPISLEVSNSVSSDTPIEQET